MPTTKEIIEGSVKRATTPLALGDWKNYEAVDLIGTAILRFYPFVTGLTKEKIRQLVVEGVID